MERVLEAFPRLRECARQFAGTLSGGERQMLAIGRGMMAEPRLLILDEPSLGLPPLLVEEMFNVIRRLSAAGLPIPLVERNVVQSLGTAARGSSLENGVFTLHGAAMALREDPELRCVHLGM